MVKGGAKAPLLTKEGWQPPRLTGWFSFDFYSRHRSDLRPLRLDKRENAKAAKQNPAKAAEVFISNFKFQISDLRLKGLPIREFVAASSLCELCVAFAFFAFKFRFGNAKAAKRNPAKTAKILVPEGDKEYSPG